MFRKYQFEIFILSLTAVCVIVYFARKIKNQSVTTTQTSDRQNSISETKTGPLSRGPTPSTAAIDLNPDPSATPPFRVIGKQDYKAIKTPAGIIGLEVDGTRHLVLRNEATFGFCPNSKKRRCIYLTDGIWAEYDDNLDKTNRMRFAGDRGSSSSPKGKLKPSKPSDAHPLQ